MKDEYITFIEFTNLTDEEKYKKLIIKDNKIDILKNVILELKKYVNKGYYKVHLNPDKFCKELLDIIMKGEE